MKNEEPKGETTPRKPVRPWLVDVSLDHLR